ncbi:MAG: prevent-host-death protein [Candidatus Parabeggiatoa sp. nov. 3]|nr:MAG: prevent-host-death protein [Gammaproteobacteria bacterium]
MLETTFTELRKNAKFLFDAVELGDTVRVYRKGKPIAHIVPTPKEIPSWKKEVPRLTLKGLSLSQEIQKDRLKTDR